MVKGKGKKVKRKRLLGRPRYRWKDNIKMELREMGWNDVYWTNLAQVRVQQWALVDAVMNLRVP
jgi:hypothetical protein